MAIAPTLQRYLAFSISVLPGRADRGGPVPDTHCSHPSLEPAAKCSVVVTDEIFGRRLPTLVSRLSRARPLVERHGTGNTSRIRFKGVIDASGLNQSKYILASHCVHTGTRRVDA
jgi:hypothetical protein